MLKLILGRAGSGKTTKVLERLCRAGAERRGWTRRRAGAERREWTRRRAGQGAGDHRACGRTHLQS